MDVLERCRAALARASDSPWVAALSRAVSAAEGGDGRAAAEALSTLPESERFFLTIALGRMWPEVLAPLAERLDVDLPGGRSVSSWDAVCDRRLFEQWATRAAERLDPHRLMRIASRGPSHLVAVAVVRHLLSAGRIEDARAVHDLVDPWKKSQRAVAQAAIAVATGDEEDVRRALAEAVAPPTIQDGGDESAAMAEVVQELTALPSSHPGVRQAIDRMRHRLLDVPAAKGTIYARNLAFTACTDAATAEDPGWLEHARAVNPFVDDDEQLEPHLAAARARVAGSEAPPPSAPPPRHPRPEPTLADIRAPEHFAERARRASERMRHRLDDGDGEEALRALTAALQPHAVTLGQHDLAEWADSLATGGGRDEAARVLVAIARTAVSGPRSMPFLVRSVWLAAAEALDGADARAFLDAARERGILVHDYAHPGSPPEPVSAYGGQLAARLDDPALELELLDAIAIEDPQRPKRAARIAAYLHALDAALGPERASMRLEAWADALGTDRGLIAAAAGAISRLDAGAIDELTGGVPPEQVEPLAVALARRGRLDEALARVEPLDARARANALVALTAVPLDEEEAGELVKAFRKCPKRSRARDDQTLWKDQLATVLCRVGRHDDAIAIAAKMPDCRWAGYGPAYAARRIARAVEDADAWTSDRAVRLAQILASRHVLPQDLPWAIVEVLVPAHRVAGAALDAAIGQIRSKLRAAGDVALLEAVSGDLEEAMGAAPRRAHRANASHFAALAAGSSGARHALLRTLPEMSRTEPGAMLELLRDLDPSDVSVVLEALADPSVPMTSAEMLRDALASAIAERALDVGDVLLAQVDAAREATTVHRRVRSVAHWLARRGRVEEACAIGQDVGLAPPLEAA